MKIPMALWARLMPLLDQALDVPAAEREAWVQTQIQTQALDDETAQALRQLIADREQLDGGGFMAELPKLDPFGSRSDASSSGKTGSMGAQGAHQSGLFPGDLIGPYRLIRQLGQGGMSVVWLAEREDGQIRRQMAIKMPHAGPGQALLAERLRRERDILASLEHRHIARLYDVGTTPSGLPFLVLEYIEGQPLPTYCDAHQLGIHERLRLFEQVLNAVQYAHTKLVLHRDLKPSNILVNAQSEVKLLDFGIAKLIRDSETGSAPSTELTQHSGHVLTPDYAAPEQIAGAPLTTASDVYALGVILFELLTAQRPYRLPRGTRGALEEAILATDPRRPSEVWLEADVQTHQMSDATLGDLAAHFKASPRKLSQQLRGDLDVIVATALQKQTARRYATADAFAQDIARHLAKEPIAAQPDSRWYRARKYVQRHAWALTAVGAVVLALSVGLGLALWQAREARQEAAKANAIKDFLVGLFENGDVEQADALRKRNQTVEQLLVNSANALGTQLKDQPQVRVELQGVVGGLLHNLAITDAAIALRKQRVAQLETMNASVAERAQALRELADSQDARGDTNGARATLERGLALCKQSGMQPATVCYGMQVARGQMYVLAREVDKAQALIEPALAALRVQAPESAQMAEALVGMGDVLSQRNESDASFKLYEEAMAVRGKLWGNTSVKLAKERYVLGMSLAHVMRLKQTDTELQKSWDTMKAATGSEHANSAQIELELGKLRAYVQSPKAGRPLIEHAAHVLLSQKEIQDPRLAFDAYIGLGAVAVMDGRLIEAEKNLREAMRLDDQLKDRLARDGTKDILYAWMLDDTGQHEEARHVINKTRDALIAEFGKDHPYVRRLSDSLVSSYLMEGKLDDAERYQRGQAKESTGNFEQDRGGQAALLIARGRFDDAERILMPAWVSMKTQPRDEQYMIAIYALYDQMGRIKLGQRKLAEAKQYFEHAIGLLADGYPGNPYLAMTRAHYGQCLLLMGDEPKAREQQLLNEKAFAMQPGVAAYFKKPGIALRAMLVQHDAAM